jgi:hypothetical protein
MARVEPRQAAELTATMSDAGTVGATQADPHPSTEVALAAQCATHDEAILEVPMPASMTKGGACRTRDWSAVSGFTKMKVLGLNRVRRPMRQVLAVLVLVVGCGKSSDPQVATPPVVTFDCTGNVAITTSAEMVAFAAQACTSVTGTLAFEGTDLTSVNLPVLTTVGALIVKSNTALTNFSLPALTTVGDLSVIGNAALTTFNLPALTTGGGTLEVTGNAALTSLSLPALTSVFILYVTGNSALASSSLPALTTVSSYLNVANNPALTSLTLPALTTAAGVDLSGNAGLVIVNVPALKKVSNVLTITGNGAYSQCLANAVMAHLEAFTGRATFYGNYEAVCMPNFLCESDVWITNNGEMAAFAAQACTSVTGNLALEGTDLTSVNLPLLTTVGALIVSNTALQPARADHGRRPVRLWQRRPDYLQPARAHHGRRHTRSRRQRRPDQSWPSRSHFSLHTLRHRKFRLGQFQPSRSHHGLRLYVRRAQHGADQSNPSRAHHRRQC